MLVTAGLFTVLWAVFCNLVLEFLQVGGNGSRILDYTLDEGLPRFLLGSAVVWALLMLFLAFTGRLWLTHAIVMALTVVVGFANYEKLRLRLEPLYPSDVDFARDGGFLGAMVGAGTVLLLIVFVALVVATLLLAGRVLSSVFPRIQRRQSPRLWWGLVVSRVVVAALCLAFFGYIAHFNAPGNRFRDAYEAGGAHWRFWFQKLNYQDNGFIGGLLYNLNVPAMQPPEGYSKKTMEQIAARYAAAATRRNSGRASGALDDVNVVLVLSEAFSDPTRIHGATLAQDPIPYTRQLMKHTVSGTMLAQLFGGGTANMEFETLTGMSLSQFEPQMNTPYQMLVPNYQQFPSAVGYFKQHGHEPIAIHPYMTSMYKREQVYPVLGFDQFIHDKTMQVTRKLEKSDFISDASAFNEVEYQIRTNDEPLLVNLVTMQNHYPMKNLYAHPLPVQGVTGEPKAEIEGYARGIKYTDEALKNFLTTLERSPEKTVVLFYGDHLPAAWPKSVYDKNGDRRMRETPFFVWSNFAQAKHEDLPTTSPIYFMNKVFDLANAPLPPYYALLAELEQQVPAMEQGLYINADNETVSKADLPARAKQLLHDYRLVEYDLSVGHRYSQAQMFYPPSTIANASGAGQ
jgi:phosphoglycerol transferase MdoB-like AlkP superfamily enzyme